MAAMFSDKAKATLEYLQAHAGEDLTSKDIAAALDIQNRSMTGTLNGLQRKGLLERVEVEGQKDKLIKLTVAGMGADPNAEKE